MKILHTVEFYSPSVGGAQEVVRQISERLAARGHQVTVATTFHPERQSRIMNGVQIEEFKIAGNAVRGIKGESERYQEFLKQGDFDIMMNYAAQQWATDLVYPVLDQIPYKKTIVPCGFSGLYWPEYADYFSALPETLGKYDQLIFPADDYRDTNFARQHGIENRSFISNGAASDEFSVIDPTFRVRYGIPSDAIMLLTVGSHTGSKGHALALEAFTKLEVAGKVFLVIVGNVPTPFTLKAQLDVWHSHFWRLFRILQKKEFKKFVATMKYLLKPLFFGGFYIPGCIQDCRARTNRINFSGNKNKRVLLLTPSNADVVAAYHAADLFIFGSNIEHSPLVLFQAMASRTPFLTLACGNAAEIVAWSKGGKLASTIQLKEGMVDGDPDTFAKEITDLLQNPSELATLAENGYAAWQDRFTWEKIALKYEELYMSLLEKKHDQKNITLEKKSITDSI